MIWTILIIPLVLASARNVRNVSPEYLDSLRSSGRDEEFARLLGVDVSLVRSNSEERAEGSIFNFVSPLGDILLTEEQDMQSNNFNKYAFRRWNNGIIPCAISESDFTLAERNFIVKALKDFNKKVKKVQIVEYSGQADYVQVISGDGCWSYLGKAGGQQPLSLQKNGCLTNGTVQHEFMHAAGFIHEHNRADRDSKIKILWGNITKKWRSQYQKVSQKDYPNLLSYDYDSVMHYPIWSPDNWKKDAFQLPPGVNRNRLGQDRGVSKGDIEKLNYLYS